MRVNCITADCMKLSDVGSPAGSRLKFAVFYQANTARATIGYYQPSPTRRTQIIHTPEVRTHNIWTYFGEERRARAGRVHDVARSYN